MRRNLEHKRLHRVVTEITRPEIDYLDKLCKDALFTTGVKLSRTQVLRALVEAARELHLTTKGVNSEEALIKRIMKFIEPKSGE